MMNISFSLPDITEEEIKAVGEVLKSGWITTGPKTKEFERRIAEHCETEQAVCLNSATACMEMTLRIMGIGPGDEVITTAYTYTATCSCICHVGATPVLVDTCKDSYEMDPWEVEKAITKNTKAIICVDLAGIIYGYYDQIYDIITRKLSLFTPNNDRQKKLGRIMIMSDAAHAFGAKREGRNCGQFADFTCFSFHAVKNLTTAEGGAVTWRLPFVEEGLYQEYMLLSLHGQSKDALAKTKAGGWEYDVVAPLYKCNMTDITAAIGLVQLDRYEGLLQRRKELIELYDRELEELDVTVLSHYNEAQESSGHLYMIRLSGKTREECNQVIEGMAQDGVAANVHYKPLPLLSAYKNMGFDIQKFPHAYELFQSEITLPLHTSLTEEEAQYVVRILKKHVRMLKSC